jgi:competence protein ComEA
MALSRSSGRDTEDDELGDRKTQKPFVFSELAQAPEYGTALDLSDPVVEGTGEGRFRAQEPVNSLGRFGEGDAPRNVVAENKNTSGNTRSPRRKNQMRKRTRTGVGLFVATILVVTAVPLLTVPAAAAEAAGVVNINSATVEQLMLLPRVGASVAQRIVEFRDQNGRFKQTVDLMLVKGIGEKTFELIEPYIAISGETNLKDKVRVGRKDGSTEDG